VVRESLAGVAAFVVGLLLLAGVFAALHYGDQAGHKRAAERCVDVCKGVGGEALNEHQDRWSKACLCRTERQLLNVHRSTGHVQVKWNRGRP
jgi:hypothetical protein